MAFLSFARFFCQQRFLKIIRKEFSLVTVILVTVTSEKFLLYLNIIILMAFHTYVLDETVLDCMVYLHSMRLLEQLVLNNYNSSLNPDQNFGNYSGQNSRQNFEQNSGMNFKERQ